MISYMYISHIRSNLGSRPRIADPASGSLEVNTSPSPESAPAPKASKDPASGSLEVTTSPSPEPAPAPKAAKKAQKFSLHVHRQPTSAAGAAARPSRGGTQARVAASEGRSY